MALRWGLVDGRARTFKEIGEAMGYTCEARGGVVWSGVLWLWLRGRGGGVEVGQRGMRSALTCFAWRLPIPCAELITFSCLFAH